MSPDSVALSPAPSPQRSQARRALPLLALVAIIIIGLLWAKWWPYADRATGLIAGGDWTGTVLSDVAVGADSWWQAGWEFTLAYSLAVWRALVVALLLAAGIQTLIDPRRIARAISGAPGASTPRGLLGGAVAGLPTMMCTCCTAPVVAGMRRAGATVGSATTFWLANPVLNPAVIVFLLVLGPWEWAAVRLGVGIPLVLLAGAIAQRLSTARPASSASALEGSTAASRRAEATPIRFLRELGRLALVLVPEYVLLVFAVGVAAYVGDWSVAEMHWSLPALILFAIVATAFVIPTGGEIAVLLALAATGSDPWAMGIALMCLSAISAPSLAMVSRALGHRAAATITGLVLIAGAAAGALLAL